MRIKHVNTYQCYALLKETMPPRGDVGFRVFYHTGWEHQYATAVNIVGDDGACGTAVLYGKDDTAPGYVQDVVRGALCGKDPRQVRHLTEALRTTAAEKDRPTQTSVKVNSAVETALWDLLARSRGVPLYELLGGSRSANRCPVYAGSASLCFDTTPRLLEKSRALVASGHIRLKIKIGHGPHEDEELVARIRETVGNRVELMVDANKAYDPDSALQFCKVLDRYGVTVFEEPTQYTNPEDYRRLRKAGSVRIAGGEIYKDVPSALKCLQEGMVDIMQCDADRLGLANLMTIAGACASYGVKFTAHCCNNITSELVGMHINLAIPNSLPQEFETFDNPLFHSMLTPRLTVKEGNCILPRKPGLGFELNMRTVEKYALR